MPEFETRSPFRRILVVDDDLSIQPIIQGMIRKMNPNSSIDWSTSAEDALELMRHNPAYHLVLSDIMLEGKKSGIDLVETCWRKRIGANFILISGNTHVDTTLPLLLKPLDFGTFREVVGPHLIDREKKQKSGVVRNRLNSPTLDFAIPLDPGFQPDGPMQWACQLAVATMLLFSYLYAISTPLLP
jgi:DNA-binding NtrC family response regulator